MKRINSQQKDELPKDLWPSYQSKRMTVRTIPQAIEQDEVIHTLMKTFQTV